jgi:luciferase family oxidoreductase group 1
MTELRTISATDLTDPTHTARLVRDLDRIGYHRFWATEHRTGGQSASPIVIATVAAASTTRIRIGTAGIKLRYYNALKVAEDFGLLELLFPGRVDLGVLGHGEPDGTLDRALVGSQGDMGGDDWYARKVARLAALLRSESSTDGATVRSARSPNPPALWVCSLDASSARLAASQSCKFAYSVYLPQQLGRIPDPDVVDIYREASAANHAAEAVIVAFGACGDSWDDAEQTWARAVHAEGRATFKPNTTPGAGERNNPNFLGTPAQCVDQLRALANQFAVSEIVVHCVGSSLEAKSAGYCMIAEELHR